MTNPPQDQNYVKGKLGVLFSDGITLVPIKINSVNNGFKVNTTDVVDSSILALYIAGKPIPRDTNGEPAWSGQSDSDPNVSFPVFVDANGAVLIDS